MRDASTGANAASSDAPPEPPEPAAPPKPPEPLRARESDGTGAGAPVRADKGVAAAAAMLRTRKSNAAGEIHRDEKLKQKVSVENKK
jgi:hypothetical protein